MIVYKEIGSSGRYTSLVVHPLKSDSDSVVKLLQWCDETNGVAVAGNVLHFNSNEALTMFKLMFD